MMKLRNREVYNVAHVHLDRKWQSWSFNTGNAASESMLFIIVLHSPPEDVLGVK